MQKYNFNITCELVAGGSTRFDSVKRGWHWCQIIKSGHSRCSASICNKELIAESYHTASKSSVV